MVTYKLIEQIISLVCVYISSTKHNFLLSNVELKRSPGRINIFVFLGKSEIVFQMVELKHARFY